MTRYADPTKVNYYAPLADMQAWAEGLMQRTPDVVIGDDYLLRWWVIPRNEHLNLYLHDIRQSDDARAFHDHPWPNESFLIFGEYIEHTPEGVFHRKAGDLVSRPANALPRLEVIPGKRCISLFQTGKIERDWGFACPQGWVQHSDYEREGGCGEP